MSPASNMQADEPAGPLKELVASRELLFTWTRREFRVRYSQSFLGAAWAVLQPLTLMIIFSVVFGFVLRVETNGVPYPLFSYAGSLPWTFFASSLTFAIPSLVNNMNLVSKIYFPREILPLSSILVCTIDFLIGAVLLIPLMLFYRTEIGINVLLLPVIVLIQIVFSFGLTLILSAMNVFYRDVRFIIPLALQILLYLSPVIYPASQIPEWLRPVYFLNPMAVLIESFRAVLLFNQPPDWPMLGLAALVSSILLLLGYRYFKSAERRFADVI
jgi:lipopolysaccharide transport system permease protein